MKRLIAFLSFFAACVSTALGQYSYTTTSLSATSDTVYAYAYTEVDYDTAYYYYVQLFGSFYWGCSVDCNSSQMIDGQWGYGASSASYSASAPLYYINYTLFAEPSLVVTYDYYNYDYQTYFYEDVYGYSLLAGTEDGVPDIYEYPPGSYEDTYTDVISLDFAFVVLDATGNPPYVGALQIWPGGDPEPGGSGYFILYGSDLSNVWGDTNVSADAGVSTTITYASPSQVNVYYTIDPSATPGTSNVWLSTAFGSAQQWFTINPPATTLLSNGSLNDAVTDWTDLGNGSFNVTLTSPGYSILEEYGLFASAGTLDLPPCQIPDPRICGIWDSADVLIKVGPLVLGAVQGLWAIWTHRTSSPVGWPGNDGTVAPGSDWTWQGTGPPGSSGGNWTKTNPDGTKESLHPDLGHAEPKGPHWDYKDPKQKWWDIWPDGTMTPKK